MEHLAIVMTGVGCFEQLLPSCHVFAYDVHPLWRTSQRFHVKAKLVSRPFHLQYFWLCSSSALVTIQHLRLCSDRQLLVCGRWGRCGRLRQRRRRRHTWRCPIKTKRGIRQSLKPTISGLLSDPFCILQLLSVAPQLRLAACVPFSCSNSCSACKPLEQHFEVLNELRQGFDMASGAELTDLVQSYMSSAISILWRME